MRKIKLKNTKGITLIALVVTIIVLIILAGVSINLVLGENGIITKARDAKDNFVKAAEDEETKLSDLYAEMNNKTGKDIKTLWPSDESTKPYLPSSLFYVSEKEGENSLEDGLVVIDNKKNEYVWIEVPRTPEVYGDILTNYETITDENREAALPLIKTALITYAGFGNEGEGSDAKTTRRGWKDEYYDGCGIVAANGKTAEENYNSLYNTMIESVYTNGGFYIGRYEAGSTTYRKESDAWDEDGEVYTPININKVTVLSQKNKYPINYVTCSEAQTLANKLTTIEYTSSLMFGLQWDLVIKYLETKGFTTLKSDCTNYGNYRNSSYSITTSADVEYSSDDGETYAKVETAALNHPSNTRTLLTTGANTDTGSTAKFDMQNIYDLAGNVYEWTLEHATSNSSYPCSGRGGYYGKDGASNPASGRYYYTEAAPSGANIGLRVSLY